MITIDTTGPDGNVFCILGHARSFQRQLKQAGGNNDTLDDVLVNFTNMTYKDICTKLESTGLFEFTDGQEEEEDTCPYCGFYMSDCDCDPQGT